MASAFTRVLSGLAEASDRSESSSGMIRALHPLHIVTVLGTSVLAVGLSEGSAEATAAITKVFSGASDRLGKARSLISDFT